MKTRHRFRTPHKLQGDAKRVKKKATEQDRPSPFLGAFANLRKVTISFVMSDVRPHGTRLPLDGFS